MSDLISVIVPVYNTGIYLEACIESVINQDYPSLEIIIVDDGSKDILTLNICQKLEKRYSNIKVVHQKNKGSASARNFGINIAKGRYVGFVDSDDTIEPNMYSSLYRDIKQNNTKIAVGGIATEEDGCLIDRVKPIHSGIYGRNDIMHYFLLGHWHSACTNLYDISLLKNVKFPENEINEDYMLNYHIFSNINSVYVNSNVFYHYIRREGSNTSSPISRKFLDWLKHTEFILKDLTKTPILKLEAEYQYLFSNIVLCNKSLLTLHKAKSEEAEEIYSLCTKNLAIAKRMIYRNKFLSPRYRIMAILLSTFPKFYKTFITYILRIKNK